MAFKIVIGTKQGTCVQKEIADPEARAFLGKRINDSIKGDDVGFPGYVFQITGGSDYCGFPMRADVPGIARKRILAVQGIGLKKKGPGVRIRKTVCGNTIHPKIAQINIKIVTAGKEPLVAPAAAGGEAKAEKAEAKPAVKAEKTEAKPAAKPEVKAEAKPAAKAAA